MGMGQFISIYWVAQFELDQKIRWLIHDTKNLDHSIISNLCFPRSFIFDPSPCWPRFQLPAAVLCSEASTLPAIHGWTMAEMVAYELEAWKV